MRKNTNVEDIQGKIYQHSLSVKTVQNTASPNFGKEYISGDIDIAVDENCMNVITVQFNYVTRLTKAGRVSSTYEVLENIINTGKTCLKDGADEATFVKVTASLALNDFYNNKGELVSAKTNRGDFIEIIANNSKFVNFFKTDMFVKNMVVVEANPEKGQMEDYVKLNGFIFNFRNDILPVEFSLRDKDGINYFENLDLTSEPVYLEVWGDINSTTVVETKKIESAFGEPAVHTTERKTKEWLVTGCNSFHYDIDEELIEEIKKALQDREVYLANVKKNKEEYAASKAAATPKSSIPNLSGSNGLSFSVPQGDFKF